MINTHLKNILDQEVRREGSADSDIKSINYYLDKLDDEEKSMAPEPPKVDQPEAPIP